MHCTYVLGGSYGRIIVNVRTIGGGEAWDNYVGVTGGSANNETVGQVIAGREPGKNAVAGQDYQILDKALIFEVTYFFVDFTVGKRNYFTKLIPYFTTSKFCNSNTWITVCSIFCMNFR